MPRTAVIVLIGVAGLISAPSSLAWDSGDPPVINDLVGPAAVADCEASAWAANDVPQGDTLAPTERRSLFSCMGEVTRALGVQSGCAPSVIEVEGATIDFTTIEVCLPHNTAVCHCSIETIELCLADGRCRTLGPPFDVVR